MKSSDRVRQGFIYVARQVVGRAKRWGVASALLQDFVAGEMILNSSFTVCPHQSAAPARRSGVGVKAAFPPCIILEASDDVGFRDDGHCPDAPDAGHRCDQADRAHAVPVSPGHLGNGVLDVPHVALQGHVHRAEFGFHCQQLLSRLFAGKGVRSGQLVFRSQPAQRAALAGQRPHQFLRQICGRQSLVLLQACQKKRVVSICFYLAPNVGLRPCRIGQMQRPDPETHQVPKPLVEAHAFHRNLSALAV